MKKVLVIVLVAVLALIFTQPVWADENFCNTVEDKTYCVLINDGDVWYPTPFSDSDPVSSDVKRIVEERKKQFFAAKETRKSLKICEDSYITFSDARGKVNILLIDCVD